MSADEIQRIRWAMERSAIRTSEAEAEVVSLRARLAAADAEIEALIATFTDTAGRLAAAEALLRRAQPLLLCNREADRHNARIDAFLAAGGDPT